MLLLAMVIRDPSYIQTITYDKKVTVCLNEPVINVEIPPAHNIDVEIPPANAIDIHIEETVVNVEIV